VDFRPARHQISAHLRASNEPMPEAHGEDASKGGASIGQPGSTLAKLFGDGGH